MRLSPRASTSPAQALGTFGFVGSCASLWTSFSGFLEQRLNLVLKLFQGHKTRVLKADRSVASDNERRRKAGHRGESLFKVIPVVTDKHRIVHLELFGELFHIRS